MTKTDLSLLLSVVSLVVPLGLTAVLIVVAFLLGMLARPWLLSHLED